MNLAAAQEQMINQQLRTWDVLDNQVLSTVRDIGRENFVAAEYRQLAFVDMELPIGHGEQMLNPKLEGRLLQALELGRTDSVLQIGVGSGYLSACLGDLAGKVLAYEQHEDLATSAQQRLKDQACASNIEIIADQFSADTSIGEFDAVAVCASVARVTDALTRTIKAGGRMFVVAGTGAYQEALLITRSSDGELRSESMFDTVVPWLSGFEPASQFSF